MRASQRAYIVLVLISGAVILGYSTFTAAQQNSLPGHFDLNSAINWIIMLALLILCRSLPVYIATDKSIELSFIPVVASAMIYGLHLTVVFFFLSTFFLFSMDKETGKIYHLLSQSLWKELFNTANILLSIFIGGFSLQWLGGYGPDFSFPYSIIPATIFAIITIAANMVIFILYFVSNGEDRFFRMLSQTVLGILPNVIATIPFGILNALMLHMENGSYFLLLFILPLLLARYSFIQYLESRTMHIDTLTALSRAIEAKDPYTRGHSERVGRYAQDIGRSLKLNKKVMSDLQFASLLHDIGKIGIEDSILNKPGSLTEEEYEQIKKHPEIGREIIEEIKFPKSVVDAVQFHHCHYDGCGYPKRENPDEALPVCASILGVADAFDAMTSDRKYRKGMDMDKAVSILKENAGTQFNPEIVEVFCEIIESNPDYFKEKHL